MNVQIKNTLTLPCCFFFFFNDTATTEIYTLSLHDALPIYLDNLGLAVNVEVNRELAARYGITADRKSTRLNSSHLGISYAVFCLKKKKKIRTCTSKTEKCRSMQH